MTIAVNELTADIARELLEYNEENGTLFWKRRDDKWFASEPVARRWNARYAGAEAFPAKVAGYKHGDFLGLRCRAHRVVWLIKTGRWPTIIDHINGDRSDNRFSNLREVTRLENQKNQKLREDNKTGCTGVFFDKRSKKFHASIKVNQAKKFLGSFPSIEGAAEARREAQVKYGFHENHGRVVL